MLQKTDAVESIFPLNTENAILVWNYISIPLSYKYDISYMLDDIIDLLGVLQSQNGGEKTIHWLPDTSRCDWEVCWNDGTIEIQAHWECTVGHLEKILNEHGTISLSVKDFESEWKEIFHVVIKGLKSCGYDQKTMGGMRDLLKQYERIRMPSGRMVLSHPTFNENTFRPCDFSCSRKSEIVSYKNFVLR